MADVLYLLEKSEEILAKTREKTGNADFDDAFRAVLTTPAVDYLGLMANQAAQSSKTAIADRFQAAAQGLIDFLEAEGHANILKEATAIEELGQFYTLRVPRIFEHKAP